MITIISGTNRKNGNSKKVAIQYQELLKERGIESTIIDLVDLPDDLVSSAMYENIGKNVAFQPTMDLMKSTEKYVFIIPEYNGSFPGILKLFLDCLEFPGTLKGKKCAVMGLSSGIQGGALALSHITDIFNYLGMHVLANKPKIMGINAKMENDRVIDDMSLQVINEQIDALIEF